MQRVRAPRHTVKLVRVKNPDLAQERAAADRIAGAIQVCTHSLGTVPSAGNQQKILSAGQHHVAEGLHTVVDSLRDHLDALVKQEDPQLDRLPAMEIAGGSPCLVDQSKCVSSVQLCGHHLQFPFPPLDPQLQMAERALQTCERRGIAVLQSPTGTGKSIALLVATLAWQRQCSRTNGCAPQIIYGVRTHAQLAQMVKELRKTPYRPRMCVIGSREQLCINAEVKNHVQRNKASLNITCRQAARRATQHTRFSKCNSRMTSSIAYELPCQHYANLGNRQHAENIHHKCSRRGNTWDMEDLLSTAKVTTGAGCPYYTAHVLAGVADIVFCPHNYIFDPAVSQCRSHHRERWSLKGRIIVVDEAHNLEQACREAGTIEAKLSELRNLRICLEAFPSKQPLLKVNMRGQEFTCREACQRIARVPARLVSVIEAHMTGNNLDPNLRSNAAANSLKGLSHVWGLPGKPGAAEFLQKAGVCEHGGISRESEEFIVEVTALLLRSQSSSSAAEEGVAMLGVLDQVLNLTKKLQLMANHPDAYVVNISTSANAASTGPTISMWLMSPGVVFETFAASAHAVLLASGTLAPLTGLNAELSASPAYMTRALREGPLEAAHVVARSQVLVMTIPRSLRSGHTMLATYESWQSPAFLLDLGHTIATLAENLPGGVLCFFPSFAALTAAISSWRTSDVCDRLMKAKSAIVTEPRSTHELEAACSEFVCSATKPGGSLCFAVFRGKMSEGLNFEDDLCRGVICVGVPYLQSLDPMVIAKRRWNDARRGCPQNAGGVTGQLLGGDEWYQLQAYRAVNQALGRCVRHRLDYGALLLLDVRWASRGERSQKLNRHLASWLQPFLEEPPVDTRICRAQERDWITSRLKGHFDMNRHASQSGHAGASGRGLTSHASSASSATSAQPLTITRGMMLVSAALPANALAQGAATSARVAAAPQEHARLQNGVSRSEVSLGDHTHQVAGNAVISTEQLMGYGISSNTSGLQTSREVSPADHARSRSRCRIPSQQILLPIKSP